MRYSRTLALVCQPLSAALLISTFVCVFAPGIARAQVGGIFEGGFKPYGSFEGGNIDTIDLMNGAFHLRIPIASYPQRGGVLKMNLALLGGSIRTQTVDVGGQGCTSGCYVVSRQNSAVGGVGPVDLVTGIQRDTTYPFTVWAISSDGARHKIGNHNVSLDGTAFLVHPFVDPVTRTCPYTDWVTDRDGITHTSGCTGSGTTNQHFSYYEDPNGNKITENFNTTNAFLNYTDTMGRTIPILSYTPAYKTSDFSGCAGPLPISSAYLLSIPGFAGGTQTLKFCKAVITFRVVCQGRCLTNTESYEDTQSLVLPNGTAWIFQYDSADPNNSLSSGSGNLLKVTFPTGGSLSYTFGRAAPTACSTNGAGMSSVSSRTLDANDGKGPQTWTYTYGVGATGYFTITVQDPLGNQMVHTFSILSNTGYINGPTCAIYETMTQQYQGVASGTPLRTVATEYETTEVLPPGNSENYPAVVPIRITTTLEDGQQTKVEKDYSFPFLNGSDRVTDGNEIAVREYDYGGGAPGPLLRATAKAYLDSTNVNYLNANLATLLSSVKVSDGAGAQQSYTTFNYDEYALTSSGVTVQHDLSPSNGSYRGNQTSSSRWLNTTGGYLKNTSTYFDTGTLKIETDPKLNSTTYAYSPTFVGAYPTTVTNALNQSTISDYDFNTGVPNSSKDANQQSTVYKHSDPLWRLTEVDYPDGGQTTYCYTDVGGPTCSQAGAPPYGIVATRAIASSPAMNETMTRLYDGVGRVSQTQFTSDPDGITYTDTTYDAFGRVVANSNPYRLTSDKTYGITTTQYDALGRVTQVAPPDGTVPTSGSSCLAKNVCTSYSGNTTTVSDQTGNARKTQTDGLGRLTTVWEDPSGLNYQTLYQYSSLGNLTCVEQHGSAATGTGCSAPPSSDATSPWRIRRFAYDSLSRLSSAKIPESGTINYSYDADGNVLTRTTPSPNQPQTGTATVTATSTYDVLNRLKGKSFTDGYAPNPATPSLSYGYDGNAPSGCTPPAITGPTNLVGRRSSMCDGSGASAWSYDSMGRIYTETRTLNSVTNTFNYRYYLDGELAHLYYPSANHADYQVTSAGRSWGVSGPGGAYIPFNTKYAPQGAVSSMWMGANYTNGQIYSNFYYSNRLQPQVGYARQFVNGVAGPLLYGYCYDFHLGVSGTFGDGNVTCSVTASALGDNGNVYKVANQVNNSRTQNFAYDTLNRITQGYTTGGSWGETFTIDAWGNLTNRGLVAGKSTYEPLNAAPATVKNQLTGFGYDPAGNMTSNGSASYIYDAENRLAATAGWTYVYDGDGERVIKCNGTYPTCTAGTLYWGGAGTDALAESSLTGTMSAEYLFYLGKRMARNDLPGNTAHYYLQDHLGSARVTTDAAGALEKQTDYSPYGGEIWTSGTNTNHYKFTGKERDAESGLDDFGDRYHASTLGRWMSPDAINATAERVLNPSNTMNKYIYGANNPLKYLDPDGKDIIVFYDHGLPAGHFIVAAYDQDTGEFAIKSFGPKNDHDSGAMAKEAIGITVPGKEMYGLDNLKSADDLRKDYSSLTIQTSPEIAQQAIEFIRSNPSGDYNTYSNNCTTTCAKVLNDIKLINFGGNWGLRPLVLWQRVYELYGNYGKEWNNGSLERPLAPNTNGTEYGHPRVGFNSFEWLYRKAKCNAWITTDKSGGGRETLCAD